MTLFTWPKYLEIKMQLKFISKGGEGVGWWLKSDIPVIEELLLGKTVNEPKTLGTTGLGSWLGVRIKNPAVTGICWNLSKEKLTEIEK